MITKAGEIVDVLDELTSPTIGEYKAGMAAGSFLIPNQQKFEEFMGDVYMRTTFYLPYQ